MIRYSIHGVAPQRSIKLRAYGNTVRLRFSWHARPAAWFVAEVDADGAPLGPERIMAHALLIKTLRDNTGAATGFLTAVDFDRDAGAFTATDLGDRLRVYGFSRSELDAGVAPSRLPAIVSVTE